MKLVLSMVLIIASLTLLNVAESWEEAAATGGGGGVIQVGGKVLCQDCTEGWNEWVSGQKPIEGISYTNYIQLLF